MAKTTKQKDNGKWFIIIMLIGLLLIIIFELQGAGEDPELIRLEEVCQEFCDSKGLKWDRIGLRQPCGAPTWDDCLICFCFVDDISKQTVPYFMDTQEVYKDMVVKK